MVEDYLPKVISSMGVVPANTKIKFIESLDGINEHEKRPGKIPDLCDIEFWRLCQ